MTTRAPNDPRAEALRRWLASQPGEFDPPWLLRADASFRRYFRTRRDGEPVVVMDAPPGREDIRPFVHIAGLLESLGLRPPRILAQDGATGFVLMEDLGDHTFTRALAEGHPETNLYTRATDTLLQLHRAWEKRPPGAGDVPSYDDRRLLDEALLWADWYWLDARGQAMPNALRDGFEAAWARTLEALPPLPETLVLRDYHVDNLMLPPDTTHPCAVLDFQDAVLGSPAYDLVSLLEDARRTVSTSVVETCLHRYLEATTWPPEAFRAHYRVLGAQRTTKILGIFVRLARRDGKSRYLEHLPRLRGLLANALQYPELAPVAGWFDAHYPDIRGMEPAANGRDAP
ncbi:MAG: aminoglycoside phosphotransferase family protein [Pseudomonadota bacterium]